MNIKQIKELSSVQLHINNLQAIINRMAANSANCKTWLITIISAVMVFALSTDLKSGIDIKNVFYILLIPVVLFYFIDSFYLSLERQFRKVYNDFIKAINSGKFDIKTIYEIKMKFTKWQKIVLLLKCMYSLSTLPFYGIFIAMLIVIVNFVVK